MATSAARKRSLRIRRHTRVRKLVAGTTGRPRLAVFRSARHISAQVIDDTTGRTLAAASTVEAGLRGASGGTWPPPRLSAGWWPTGPPPPG